MELYAFSIMLLCTNAFFLIREITIVVQHSKDDDKTSLDTLDYVLSIAGIAGAVLCTILVIAISKPVYSNMFEEVFLRIGGNRNVWCKLIIIESFIEMYKYF